MSQHDFLTTSQLARAAGVGVQALRYYERRGLLPEPRRTTAGHRQFNGEHLRRVRFIRKAQELGFQLDEIRELLGLRVVRGEPCDGAAQVADRVVERIDQKVSALQAMRKSLKRLRSACDEAEPTGHCPILDALEEDVQ